jgi:hypothetical protein
MNVLQRLLSLGAQADAPSEEERFGRDVDQELLTALRKARDESGPGQLPEFPASPCLDAVELQQSVQAGLLPPERQKHLETCLLCREMRKHAQLTPDQVEAMAMRLARPPEPTDAPEADDEVRRQRAELRQEQEADFEEGRRRGGAEPALLGVVERSAGRNRGGRILVPACSAILLAVVCYPQVIPDALSPVMSNLGRDREGEAVRVLTGAGEVRVKNAEGTITPLPLSASRSGEKQYIFKVPSGKTEAEYPLIDKEGRLAAIPDGSFGAKVSGKLLMGTGGKTSIDLDHVEFDKKMP